MIEVQHLVKRYNDHLAVNDVSFTVEKGQILGLLGPNGAGKSTTMKIITGFLPPSSGKVTVGGYDIFENSLEARRHLGYLPENPPLYVDMTVSSYLDFVSKLKGVPAARRKERLDTVLQQCWLTDVRHKLINKLSKGYRQRVGLAGALIHDPDVLILDEPTAGLDPKQINETRQLIKSLAGKHTVILSTHILPEVEMTCEKVVIINKGRVVAQDTPERLRSRLKGGEQIAVVVRGPRDEVAAELARIEGVREVHSEPHAGPMTTFLLDADSLNALRETIASRIVAAGWGLHELKSVGYSLEETFLRLTTQESDHAEAPAEVAV
ncbi:MAG: ATP-binding cassette domain-containing protein [Candidatus Sericytochromatia bacterium]|nr:ATP-binding cassette domain-containing protein [Candidatus Sericytochromatia bacterium]